MPPLLPKQITFDYGQTQEELDWVPIIDPDDGEKCWRYYPTGEIFQSEVCPACKGTCKNLKGNECWCCDGTGRWV